MINISIDPNIYISEISKIKENNYLISEIFDNIKCKTIKIIYNKYLDQYKELSGYKNLFNIDLNSKLTFSEIYFARNSHKLKYIKEVYSYQDTDNCSFIEKLPNEIHGFISSALRIQYNDYYNNIIISNKNSESVCENKFELFNNIDILKWQMDKNLRIISNNELCQKILEKEFFYYLDTVKVFLGIRLKEKKNIIFSQNFINSVIKCEKDSKNFITSLVRGIYYPMYLFSNGQCNSPYIIEAHPHSPRYKKDKNIYINKKQTTLYGVYVLAINAVTKAQDNKYRIFYVFFNDIYIILSYTDEHDFNYDDFKVEEKISFESIEYVIKSN
ncbi:hypothetical protein [Arcobacter ellisii]|uniref:Uncharacterized protein n=1 Tax=Arcobacter ellisii TaxID=913109 RepID=A0A347UB41_9BACT|nr:hypothetical protein [Arcobacter ellisii]AXX96069.1 hypothetical protein AELL_2452 [Arcobacter ellisii]RXI28934.1 hypothetical protein CP962_12695 [Arcobacter ellisii]